MKKLSLFLSIFVMAMNFTTYSLSFAAETKLSAQAQYDQLPKEIQKYFVIEKKCSDQLGVAGSDRAELINVINTLNSSRLNPICAVVGGDSICCLFDDGSTSCI